MNTPFTRRDMLVRSAQVGAAALAAHAGRIPLLADEKEAAVPEAPIPIIDAHQHLWDLTKIRLPWLETENQPLRRNFVLADYDEATKQAAIEKTVYMEVNCHPDDHVAEAEYVLALCRDPKSKMRGAVIGGSIHTTGFPAYIKKYAGNPHIKGVRMILHEPDRPAKMCVQKQFVENVQLLGELGMCFDLCMRPEELLDAVALVEKCPKTQFVVDHCGNIDVHGDADSRKKWEQGIQAAAKQLNTVCKISGIIVSVKPKVWKPGDLAPSIDFCLDTFGEDRVIFAGDWPVCMMRASYQEWLDALKTIVAGRTHAFRKKLFHDNAERFYKLS